jgi:hypothetical protein
MADRTPDLPLLPYLIHLLARYSSRIPRRFRTTTTCTEGFPDLHRDNWRGLQPIHNITPQNGDILHRKSMGSMRLYSGFFRCPAVHEEGSLLAVLILHYTSKVETPNFNNRAGAEQGRVKTHRPAIHVQTPETFLISISLAKGVWFTTPVLRQRVDPSNERRVASFCGTPTSTNSRSFSSFRAN